VLNHIYFISLARAASLLANMLRVLAPMIPPPQCLCSSSALAMKPDLMVETREESWALSSAPTSVMARAVAVFLWTTVPSLALPLTIQYGTPIFLQRAGSQRTISIGSTSSAITTSWAFLASTKAVMWLIPYLTTTGFLPWSTLLPSAAELATAARRSFFSFLVSGLYLLRSLKTWVAVFLSKTLLNWLIAGGTLRRCWRTTFWRWRRMYSGHLTKRERSLFGRTSWPIPKFFGVFSVSGFFGALVEAFLNGNGAGATFLDFWALGYII